MTEDHEVLQILDEHHVRHLTHHQQLTLAGMRLAMTTSQMAAAFGCSEATVVRTRRRTLEEVFDFLELDGTPQLLRLWSERHWTCCTASAHEMTENSHLLTAW